MEAPLDSSPPRREAVFNVFGAFCFAAAFLVGYYLGIHPIGNGPDSWGYGALGQRIIGFLATVALGFICAVVAAFRKERYWAITVVALFVNGVPLIGLVALVLSH